MIGAPHFLGWVLLGGAVGLLAGCASHGAGVEGQVFEAMSEAPVGQEARRPSADAYVLVHWTGTLPQFGHASSMCLRAAIGKTDERGRFEVPGWWAAPKIYPVILRDPAFMALGPLPPTLHHYLATIREKAGVPQPPEPPRQIRPIGPQGPRPAAPAPAAPANPQ
jgi:hypothetical protein